jgi:hypothetical protein
MRKELAASLSDTMKLVCEPVMPGPHQFAADWFNLDKFQVSSQSLSQANRCRDKEES